MPDHLTQTCYEGDMKFNRQFFLIFQLCFLLSLGLGHSVTHAFEIIVPKALKISNLPPPLLKSRHYLVEYKKTNLGINIGLKFQTHFTLNRNGQMVFQVQVPRDFKENSFAAHSLKEMIKALIESAAYPEQAIERLGNLKNPDPLIIEDLLSLLIIHFEKLESLSETDAALLSSWKKQRLQNREDVRAHKTKTRVLKTRRKSLLTQLDADQERQLKYLVQKNKRPQVAKLINSYLAWEEMSSVEKKYWLTIIEAIKNPVPLNERLIVFRGLDKKNNRLHLGEWKNNIRPFIFSIMLDKNQGSYNRRLRSLETMYTKRPTATHTVPSLDHRYSRSQRVSNLSKNHSQDPIASPLISFTSDIRVAKEFAQMGLLAVALDPRLLLPGSLNPFGENEWLAPILTFPEDTLFYLEKSHHLDEKNFWNEVEHSLQPLYGAIETRKLISLWKKNLIPVFLSLFEFQTFTRPFYSLLQEGDATTPRSVTEYQKIFYNLQ